MGTALGDGKCGAEALRSAFSTSTELELDDRGPCVDCAGSRVSGGASPSSTMGCYNIRNRDQKIVTFSGEHLNTGAVCSVQRSGYKSS